MKNARFRATVMFSVPFLFAFTSCSEDIVEPDTTPPTVMLTFPIDGDTIGSETPLSASADDNIGIASVRFYVEERMIAEDSVIPYDQIWFSGFWEDGKTYSIHAETTDESGNTGRSDPVAVYLADDSRFVTEIVQPVAGGLAQHYRVTYRWIPVPGARGYILRLVIPEYGIDQFSCDDAGHETCYLNVSGTKYADNLPLPPGLTGEGTLDVIVDVKAYWDCYHGSEWSDEVRFRAELPEEPPPADIQEILEGVHLSIRERYGGHKYLWYHTIGEPEITVLLETSHQYPYSNYKIKYDCTVSSDTICIELTGIDHPYIVSPAYGTANVGVRIYPEPGDYTLLLTCHKSTDVFSVEVSELSIEYQQESQVFAASDPELVWRIRENSFYFQERYCSPGDEWMIQAFRDSLRNMGLFEEFEYPEGGVLPYDMDRGDCDFFLYDSEEDFTAACEMLDTFVQDPLYSDGDFWIALHSWINDYCDSYGH